MMFTKLKERSKRLFAVKALVGIIISVFGYYYFESWVLKSIAGLLGILIVFFDLYRILYSQPRVLKTIIVHSKNIETISWLKNGAIDLEKNPDLIIGFAKVASFYFTCGTRYDKSGIFVQFVSVSAMNVQFFEWDCFQSIERVVLNHKGDFQESAIFKVSDNSPRLMLPWDINYDYVFDSV